MCKKLFILAGSYKQAMEYAQNRNMSKDDFIYITGKHSLLGCKNCKMVRVGAWHERPDGYELNEIAVLRDFEIFNDHIFNFNAG